MIAEDRRDARLATFWICFAMLWGIAINGLAIVSFISGDAVASLPFSEGAR